VVRTDQEAGAFTRQELTHCLDLLRSPLLDRVTCDETEHENVSVIARDTLVEWQAEPGLVDALNTGTRVAGASVTDSLENRTTPEEQLERSRCPAEGASYPTIRRLVDRPTARELYVGHRRDRFRDSGDYRGWLRWIRPATPTADPAVSLEYSARRGLGYTSAPPRTKSSRWLSNVWDPRMVGASRKLRSWRFSSDSQCSSTRTMLCFHIQGFFDLVATGRTGTRSIP